MWLIGTLKSIESFDRMMADTRINFTLYTIMGISVIWYINNLRIKLIFSVKIVLMNEIGYTSKLILYFVKDFFFFFTKYQMSNFFLYEIVILSYICIIYYNRWYIM